MSAPASRSGVLLALAAFFLGTLSLVWWLVADPQERLR